MARVDLNKIKLFMFFLWIILILIFFYLIFRFNINPKDFPILIKLLVSKYEVYGWLVFILISALRPLTFIPATILTISAALLFGSVVGFLLIFIGENLSATLSYFLGKYFLGNFFENFKETNQKINNLNKKFKNNSFLSILVLRLTYLPFDMVGYFAGIHKINYIGYIQGTALGIIPGILTFIFLGGSLHNPIHLFLGIFLFLFGLILSKYLLKIKR